MLQLFIFLSAIFVPPLLFDKILKIRFNESWSGGNIQTANIISSINITFLIYGVVINLFDKYTSTSALLSNHQFYTWSLFITLIFILIYVSLSAFLVKKPAEIQTTLFEVFTFGFIGFYLTIFSVMVNINQLFDNSESIEKTVNIYEHQDHSRRGISHCYLVIGSNSDEKSTVPVSESIYIKSLRNNKITVIERAGFLNQHYIGEFKI
nr:hypothetical protein [uncultured Tolumonas sp.]